MGHVGNLTVYTVINYRVTAHWWDRRVFRGLFLFLSFFLNQLLFC